MATPAPPTATLLPGQLGLYAAQDSPYRTYPYFESGDLGATKAVVFIGGLSNGLGGVPYTPKLSGELAKIGWKLVQTHWSSAYENFGRSSLDVDVAELGALVTHLRKLGTRTIVVMGHSTGSQDVLRYLTHRADADGGIMQAPVSDREHFILQPETKPWFDQLPLAEKLLAEGKGDTVLDYAFDAHGLRLTAYRAFSLLSPKGDDDYFSSDIPDTDGSGAYAHPLDESFGRLSAPALALYSEKDEYAHVPDIDAHIARWVKAAHGKLDTHVVKGANHAVEDPAHQVDLAAAVVAWLGKTFK
ncbi:hypothetical protein VHUM_03937 [Vanrija humicola]|uniref:AB hydrolase-1 domain-containing protein n=1 Tax=Vanrija humicola TaxID=5417 RepID=A0A7D8UW10_VANHU|nr:hypothetical protein VHUM_03937 [Vanrija humicola]